LNRHGAETGGFRVPNFALYVFKFVGRISLQNVHFWSVLFCFRLSPIQNYIITRRKQRGIQSKTQLFPSRQATVLPERIKMLKIRSPSYAVRMEEIGREDRKTFGGLF